MKADGVRIESECLVGQYRDICDLIGYVAVEKLFLHYGGGYVSLPKKLLTDEFVHGYIVDCYKRGRKPKELAKDYDYTYSWILKIIRTSRG